MILLIDNYDSFTYNVASYVESLGHQIQVIQNDAISVNEINHLHPTKIILSPGPGNPSQSGITLDVIKHYYATYPILGICLGHQAIAQAFGAKIIPSKNLMHGKQTIVEHTSSSIFNSIPNSFNAIRYNSLTIDEKSMPNDLVISAWSKDNRGNKEDIMAIEHQDFPVFGVQFHPESIGSEYGLELINNFCEI